MENGVHGKKVVTEGSCSRMFKSQSKGDEEEQMKAVAVWAEALTGDGAGNHAVNQDLDRRQEAEFSI